MNDKYIILQKSKQKVRLLAGNDTWNVSIAGKTYHVDIFMEALFTSLIYEPLSDSTREMMHYINDRYDKGAQPTYVEKFISIFKEFHKPVEASEGELVAPCILAHGDYGCGVPFYKYACAISQENEERLIKESLENPYEAWRHCKEFFQDYIIKYDQDFDSKMTLEEQAIILSENFLKMHGITDCRALGRKNSNAKASDSKKNEAKRIVTTPEDVTFKSYLIAFLIMAGSIYAAYKFMEASLTISGIVLVGGCIFACIFQIVYVLNRSEYNVENANSLGLIEKERLFIKEKNKGWEHKEQSLADKIDRNPKMTLIAIFISIVVMAAVGWYMMKSKDFFVQFIGFMLIFGPTSVILDKLGLLKRRR